VLDGRVFRVLGNAMFATIFVAAIFCVFLTPLAGVLRTSPVIGEALGLVSLVVGLLLVVPLMALTGIHTSTFLAVEFLLAFVELVIDSIPGILLRLNDTVVDGVAAARARRGGRTRCTISTSPATCSGSSPRSPTFPS
jgi:hypothetical protein